MEDDSNDYVNTEIVCTLAAIGYIEGNDYYKGEECLGKIITRNIHEVICVEGRERGARYDQCPSQICSD